MLQTTYSINDLLVTLYPAGTFNSEAVAKITQPDSEQELFILANELRPLGEWLIKCADEIGNPGYVKPFTGNDERAEREDAIFTAALTDDTHKCPECGNTLSSLETYDEFEVWCMSCGYESDGRPDNVSPQAIGLEPIA